MRFNQPLNDLLGQQSKVKILRFLINNDMELAGREIARTVSLAQRTTHSALMDLWRQGIVGMRRAGKAKLYKINKENVFVLEALIPLFSFEGKLLSRLVASIIGKTKKQAVSMVVFGSVAKGNERPNSDIDLLIVLAQGADSKKIELALDGLVLGISQKFGNLLSPVLLKESQFRSRYNHKDRFIRAIVANGKVIYGKTFMEMIYV